MRPKTTPRVPKEVSRWPGRASAGAAATQAAMTATSSDRADLMPVKRRAAGCSAVRPRERGRGRTGSPRAPGAGTRRAPAGGAPRRGGRAAGASARGRTARSRSSARARRPPRTRRAPPRSARAWKQARPSASRIDVFSGVEVAGARERHGGRVVVAVTRAARCRGGTGRRADSMASHLGTGSAAAPRRQRPQRAQPPAPARGRAPGRGAGRGAARASGRRRR